MTRLSIAAGWFVFVVSCAQPPRKEVAMASARVETARAQDAAVFAPERFAEAESALDDARRSLASSSEYGAALRAAATASLRADEAFIQARGERIVVERKLDHLLFELESLVEMAARGAAGQSTPEELTSLRGRFEIVRELAQSGNVLAAYHEGSALKPELVALEQSLRN